MNGEKKEIELPYVSIKFEAPIVYFVYKEDVELGFPEIRELIFYAEKFSGKKNYFTFSDVTMNVNITNEGKRIVANAKNMPYFKGTAVLVKNDIFKFAANFLNQFHKPNYPFRAFTSRDKAIAWLLTLPLD
jgi:hypothetical protein